MLLFESGEFQGAFKLPASHPMQPFPSSSPAARILVEIRRQISRLPLVAGRAGRCPAAGEIARLSGADLLGAEVSDPDMARAARAGLFLRAEAAEEAHAICQEIATPEGSYWHAILHRREPDHANASYWFRRAGSHPLFVELGMPAAGETPAAGPAIEACAPGGIWDPYRFAELCAACEAGEKPELRGELEELQEREIELLLQFCCRRALAPAGREPGPSRR